MAFVACACLTPWAPLPPAPWLLMQADFSFFFDTAGRRKCYIAPERFYDAAGAGTAQEAAGSQLTPAMVGGWVGGWLRRGRGGQQGCPPAGVHVVGRALFAASPLRGCHPLPRERRTCFPPAACWQSFSWMGSRCSTTPRCAEPAAARHALLLLLLARQSSASAPHAPWLGSCRMASPHWATSFMRCALAPLLACSFWRTARAATTPPLRWRGWSWGCGRWCWP